MIGFLATSEHLYTTRIYLDMWGTELRDRVRLLSYDDLLTCGSLPAAAYIFADLERLSPVQLELAGCVWRQLAATGDAVRLLNAPSRSQRRFELQRQLHQNGTNSFQVHRATEGAANWRYPVFLREEREHSGSLTRLLHSRGKVRRALAPLHSAAFGSSRDVRRFDLTRP